jgi:hypothetical protein
MPTNTDATAIPIAFEEVELPFGGSVDDGAGTGVPGLSDGFLGRSLGSLGSLGPESFVVRRRIWLWKVSVMLGGKPADGVSRVAVERERFGFFSLTVETVTLRA